MCSSDLRLALAVDHARETFAPLFNRTWFIHRLVDASRNARLARFRRLYAPLALTPFLLTGCVTALSPAQIKSLAQGREVLTYEATVTTPWGHGQYRFQMAPQPVPAPHCPTNNQAPPVFP